MSRRTATWLAWAFVAATVGIFGAWAWLLVLNARAGLHGDSFAYSSILPNAAPAVAFVVVGFLVASRKPGNPIGWLLLVTGPIFGLSMLATQYAAYVLLAGHDSLPAGRAVAIASNGTWIPGLFVIILLAFLFPTGLLPTPRWRFAVWLSAASLTLLFLVTHTLELDPPFTKFGNPLQLHLHGTAALVSGVVFFLILLGLLASALSACASVVVRFRRSAGDEREQLKWFVFAAAIIPLGLTVHLIAETAAPGAVNAVEAGYSLGIALLPIAIGIAVLKYRLYEIDRIISRTLVYGSLTVVLAASLHRSRACWAGAVLVVRWRLEPRCGCVDARRCGAVPAGTLAGAAARRPTLLPPPLRRAAHARRLRRPAPRTGRSRHAERRAPGRRRRDDAAGACVGLAQGARVVTTRTAARVAWSFVALTVVLHVASGVFVFLGRHVHTPADKNFSVGAVGFFVAFLAFPVVGAAIVSRRPGNAIGWLFLFIGLDFAVSDLTVQYADYGLFADPGSLPAGVWVGWLSGWLDPVVFVSIMFVLLLFPDGGALSPRWRPVVGFVASVVVLGVLWNALKPAEIFSDSLPVQNPAGVQWLGKNVGFMDTIVFMGFAIGAVLSVTSAILRFRRSRGIERDQMKGLALAALLLIVGFVTAAVLAAFHASQISDLVIGLGFAGVAVSVGIGVLRYRLYEIDRVISRTLSFACVTAALGVAYVGLVLLGQSLFASVAGGGGLVVAVSTLVVAALFLPVRSRVQRFVDRRFYRRRYDAQRTLEAFGARLREQVDLDTLLTELHAVVAETMQPAHASVWAREGDSRR